MYIRKLGLSLLLTIAVSVCHLSPAVAALISIDDPNFGTGALTLDTSTNMTWLDLSITEGMSFNDVSSQLGASGTYSGYRYASPEEVYSLFVEALIPNINDPGTFGHYGTVENARPALHLIGLMGPSYQVEISGVKLSSINGFSSQHNNSNGFDLIQMPYATVREGVITSNGPQSYGEVFTVGSSIFPSNPYEGVGSWLVKTTTVPVPSTAWLFGIAFFRVVKVPRRAKK
ncbi:Uncharacterised protein [Halioglobus japonicus]|nr:Uncharacterised protein [Halioglobus japonicus]